MVAGRSYRGAVGGVTGRGMKGYGQINAVEGLRERFASASLAEVGDEPMP